jgi:hypothetical protein
MNETVAVEMHLRLPDCQVCDNEINPGREEYIGRTRVCPRCYGELTSGRVRKDRKYRIKKQ